LSAPPVLISCAGHIVAHKDFFRARLQLLAPLPQYRGHLSDPSPVCAVPRFISSFQAPVSEVQPKVQLDLAENRVFKINWSDGITGNPGFQGAVSEAY
jgi:hypothetical protein